MPQVPAFAASVSDTRLTGSFFSRQIGQRGAVIQPWRLLRPSGRRPYALPVLSTRTHRRSFGRLCREGDDTKQHSCSAPRASSAGQGHASEGIFHPPSQGGQAPAYVPLHVHSDFSLLDGASLLPGLVARAKELGMAALALTDHGVMYGVLELMRLCRAAGIKPIIGNEVYLVEGDLDQNRAKPKRYHLTVLAKNHAGYRNLVRLTTISQLKGMQGKGIFARPCINRELLYEHREGLLVCSGCMAGEVAQALLAGNMDKAREVVAWHKECFQDDYYLEIMDHGREENVPINTGVMQLAQELGVQIVATNDSHFTCRPDALAHDALLCIQTGARMSDNRRMRYTGQEYLKSGQEMLELFQHIPVEERYQAIANTAELASKVEEYELFSKPQLPGFDVPPGHDEASYLEQLAWRGLCSKMGWRGRRDVPALYRHRLAKELSVIHGQGFSAYFLVVWDIIRFARENGIPVGPGRGSAAGSLVAYALNIIAINPVEHGLLFERFLNEERQSLPDIDTDFCIEQRDRVIDYVARKYGEGRVAQIVTFNRLASKAVLKDVGRVLGRSYGETDALAKLVPVVRGKPARLASLVADTTPCKDFKRRYDDSGEVKEWVDMAMKLEGTHKTYGVHAAGVVIAPASYTLADVVPLQRGLGDGGAVVTQYAMEDIEALGLIKMDLLGLRNLTVIARTYTFLSHQGIHLPPMENLPTSNPATFALLARGELDGVFQLDMSQGMKKVVRELAPSCLNEIFAILALYRPGPLDAGLVDEFIARKHGRKEVTYETPELEPILRETYGVLLYQEQIMRVAQDLAGYSLGQADILRRAMGKKKPEEMEAQRQRFTSGAVVRGVSASVAASLFEQMLKFAEYCFNKSHSAAYGYITYITAYLKANYPVAFMAALLSCSTGDPDKMRRYISTCRQSLSIPVLPPCINTSGMGFTPVPHHTSVPLPATAYPHFPPETVSTNVQLAASGPSNAERIWSAANGRPSVANRSPLLANGSPPLVNGNPSTANGKPVPATGHSFADASSDLTPASPAPAPDPSHPLPNPALEHWQPTQLGESVSPMCAAHGPTVQHPQHTSGAVAGLPGPASAPGAARSSSAPTGTGQDSSHSDRCSSGVDASSSAETGGTRGGLGGDGCRSDLGAGGASSGVRTNGARNGLVTHVSRSGLEVVGSRNGLETEVASISVERDRVGGERLSLDAGGVQLGRNGEEASVSGRDTTGAILFGLVAVRHVGEAAANAILDARERGGPFTSLVDLCTRVDTAKVPKRALEALTQCGALDALDHGESSPTAGPVVTHPNRRRLLQELDRAHEYASRMRKQRAAGQGNLFDLLGGRAVEASARGGVHGRQNNVPLAGPVPGWGLDALAEDVEDFPPSMKLGLEKEMLGFYVTDHPLRAVVARLPSWVRPIELGDCEEHVDSGIVMAVVLLTKVTKKTTKSGASMAVVHMEDCSGHLEGVMFQPLISSVAAALVEETAVVVWGELERRDNGMEGGGSANIQMKFKNLIPVEQAQVVRLDFTVDEAGDPTRQKDVKALLQAYGAPGGAESRGRGGGWGRSLGAGGTFQRGSGNVVPPVLVVARISSPVDSISDAVDSGSDVAAGQGPRIADGVLASAGAASMSAISVAGLSGQRVEGLNGQRSDGLNWQSSDGLNGASVAAGPWRGFDPIMAEHVGAVNGPVRPPSRNGNSGVAPLNGNPGAPPPNGNSGAPAANGHPGAPGEASWFPNGTPPGGTGIRLPKGAPAGGTAPNEMQGSGTGSWVPNRAQGDGSLSRGPDGMQGGGTSGSDWQVQGGEVGNIVRGVETEEAVGGEEREAGGGRRLGEGEEDDEVAEEDDVEWVRFGPAFNVTDARGAVERLRMNGFKADVVSLLQPGDSRDGLYGSGVLVKEERKDFMAVCKAWEPSGKAVDPSYSSGVEALGPSNRRELSSVR